MKAIARIATAIAITIGTFTPVLAATGVREDHSGIVVWVFLGFCALIVAAQLVPAVLMMLGLVKGAVESTRETATEKVSK